MTKNLKNLQPKKKLLFFYQKLQFTYPKASIKGVQLQKKPSTLKSKHLAPPDLNLVQALPVDPGLPAAPLLSARPCIALGLLCVFGNGNFYGGAWPIFQIDSESQWE